MAQQQFWIVYTHKNDGRLERFDNYQDAEDEAKRKAVFGDSYVLAPIAFVKQPVPDITARHIPLHFDRAAGPAVGGGSGSGGATAGVGGKIP